MEYLGRKIANFAGMNKLPFLIKNLKALAEVKNPAAFWLARQRPDEKAVAERLLVNHWKLMDIKLPEGGTLFESFPPLAHYKSWVEENDKLAQSATIIVGCNIGYGLNHVLVNTPNTHKVMVIEPDPEMLIACLGQTDYTPFFEIGKLHFLPPDVEVVRKAVQMADKQFLFGRIYLRSDFPSQQIGPEYAKWTRICKEQLEGLTVELTTLRRRQDVMVGNEMQNFRNSFRHGSLRDMQDTAKGLTAVILGAGPSLQVNGPLLAKNPGHLFYAAALQTLPAVQKTGIKPHLAMAIDYSAGMKRVFNMLDMEWARDIPLIYSTKLDPEVVNRYPGPLIPLWTLGGLATYVMKGNEYILDAGGNVSVAMFRFLTHCGVSRVLLCGQDFSWKGGLSHAEGHHASRTNAKSSVTMQNLQGETLHSALSYVTALRDLERDIERSGVEVMNFYGGYAVIKGARHFGENELVSQGLNTSAPGSLKIFLDNLKLARIPRPIPAVEPRYPAWSSSLRNAMKHMDKLFKRPAAKQKEIRDSMHRFHTYLRHDPLLVPYLYNEFMDVAGLAHGARKFDNRDNVEFKKIVRRVQDKVKHFDSLLGPETSASAAA